MEKSTTLIEVQSSHLPAELTTEVLNDFFSNLGERMAEKYKDASYGWSLPQSIHSFNYVNVDAARVSNILKLLPDRSNLDVLDMDGKMLKVIPFCSGTMYSQTCKFISR